MSTEMVFTPPPAPVLLPGVPDSSLSDYVIPPAMRTLVYAFQQINGAPVPTNLVTILTTLAVVFGGDINVESPHNGTLPLTFYALIASGTGEGKTRVLHSVMEPLRIYESRIQEAENLNSAQFTVDLQHWKAEGKSLKRALEKAVEDKNQSMITRIEKDLLRHEQRKPNRPTPLKKIITDVSLRGLRDSLMAADGESLVLTNSDSSRFLHESLITNAPEFCSAWSGEPLNIAKRGVKIRADNPRLSMILMVQPAMIEDFFEQDHEFRVSGLAARFLTFFPDSLIGQRFRIPNQPSELYQSAIEDWHDKIITQMESSRLRRVACGESNPETIRLSPEAKQFLQNHGARLDFVLGNPNGEFADITDIALRLIEYTCKIAALFELFDDPKSLEIKPHNVDVALNFMIEHARSFKKTCNPNKPKASSLIKANKILHFLRRPNKHYQQVFFNGLYYWGLPMDVFQRHGPVRKKIEHEEAINILELNGIIFIANISFYNGYKYVTKKFILLIDINKSIQQTSRFDITLQ